jgi:DNA-binding transcriptional ArsR family regulator
MPNYDAVIDRTFRALADPTRRAMVERLARGPASVSELAKPFRMALPSLLEHLRALENSGLVATAKVGRVRTCRLDPAPIERTQAWLARQRAVWEGRLDRLEDHLAALQGKGNGRKKRWKA